MMAKIIVVHPLPYRKNNFQSWVDRFGSTKVHQKEPFIKSVYIRRSLQDAVIMPENWDNVQSNSRSKYQEKNEIDGRNTTE